MLICSTKKLLDKIDVELVEKEEAPFFTWHANLVNINYRKTLILFNEKTGFTVIVHGLTKKEFNNIESVIKNSIIDALTYEGYSKDAIFEFLKKSGEIRFSKTQGKSKTARLNAVCRDIINMCSSMIFPHKLNQPYASYYMNHFIRKLEGIEEYIHPCEEMYKKLMSLISIKQLTAKINVKMLLENFEVERTFTIPLDDNFEILHLTIQRVFAWQNYHLYGFDIYDEKFKKIILELVEDEEALSFPSKYERKLAYELYLKDYLYKNQKLIYRYDFGDGWEHLVTVLDIYETNELKPIFIEGKGDALPEDVGGEYGYEQFLDIINNPSHEDYEMMVSWGYRQNYEKYNPRLIKYRL